MIRVHLSYRFDGSDLFLLDESGAASGATKLARVEDGRLVFADLPLGADAVPTPRLRHEAAAVLTALREALDNAGVRSDRDAKIEGTLTATRAHLADMRELLGLSDTKAGAV